MQMTKKLEKLLAKYKKANRARLTAYKRRSRTLNRDWPILSKDGTRLKYREPTNKVPITEELKAKLNADIEVARLYKLEVSAELRAYCKKKKYHIQWDSSNQVRRVLSHLEWQLRTREYKHHAPSLFIVMHKLNLTKSLHYCL